MSTSKELTFSLTDVLSIGLDESFFDEASADGDALLLEIGDFLLLENGDKLLLE